MILAVPAASPSRVTVTTSAPAVPFRLKLVPTVVVFRLNVSAPPLPVSVTPADGLNPASRLEVISTSAWSGCPANGPDCGGMLTVTTDAVPSLAYPLAAAVASAAARAVPSGSVPWLA